MKTPILDSKILEFLDAGSPSTIGEIQAHLNSSYSGTFGALKRLIANSEVSVSRTNPNGRRGRPTNYYSYRIKDNDDDSGTFDNDSGSEAKNASPADSGDAPSTSPDSLWAVRRSNRNNG